MNNQDKAETATQPEMSFRDIVSSALVGVSRRISEVNSWLFKNNRGKRLFATFLLAAGAAVNAACGSVDVSSVPPKPMETSAPVAGNGGGLSTGTGAESGVRQETLGTDVSEFVSGIQNTFLGALPAGLRVEGWARDGSRVDSPVTVIAVLFNPGAFGFSSGCDLNAKPCAVCSGQGVDSTLAATAVFSDKKIQGLGLDFYVENRKLDLQNDKKVIAEFVAGAGGGVRIGNVVARSWPGYPKGAVEGTPGYYTNSVAVPGYTTANMVENTEKHIFNPTVLEAKNGFVFVIVNGDGGQTWLGVAGVSRDVNGRPIYEYRGGKKTLRLDTPVFFVYNWESYSDPNQGTVKPEIPKAVNYQPSVFRGEYRPELPKQRSRTSLRTAPRKTQGV